MSRLFVDLETYSAVPIQHGTHVYAAAAEIMLFAWAIDDAPVQVWDRSCEDVPPALDAALRDPQVEIWAHHSHFDRTVLGHQGGSVGRAAAADVGRWRDTMVQALCHGLPGSLDALCEILGVPLEQAKIKDGRQLVHLFCKPRPATSKITRATSATHPAEWARFVEYAGRDIDAMRAVRERLPVWNYRGAELELWHRDQAINDRGVAVDVELADAAIGAVERAQVELAGRTVELTAGAVESTTRRDALLVHLLAEHGVALPDLRADTVERRIADPNLPAPVRELLAVRLQASTASTAKYKALRRCVSADGRLRGALQYSGASRTRRWAGRLFQPQNLPRPSLPADEIDTGIEAIKAGCADLITDNVMQLASNALRGCIVAPPGQRLVVSDLANIEGRVAAWLGGEQWKLDAFRAYDAGDGPDLYRVAYAKAFAIKPEQVTKDQRQIGKVMELMLQYEGGVGAFITGAATYGIDLDAMADAAWETLPPAIVEEAGGFLEWTRKEKRPTFGLAERTFIVCDALKRLWRGAHPGIVALWSTLRGAAISATEWPGQRFPAGLMAARRQGSWLGVRLPSGNVLCYPQPQVLEGTLRYAGINQYSRKWGRQATYGGRLLENACQSLARDVMAANMPRIEQAGFAIVLTVHDEVIAEAPDADAYSAASMSALLATQPAWAPGLPLAASGFTAHRYHKE